jgi:hypothetical protein
MPESHSNEIFQLVGPGVREHMACKVCGADNLMNLEGEVTASFPSIKNAKIGTSYFLRSSRCD